MNSPHHPHHDHHDVHQQSLLWFFSFCNQGRGSSGHSSSSSTSSHGSGGAGGKRSLSSSSRRKAASNRNKFALQYQQQLLQQQRQSSNVFGLDIIEHTQRFGEDDAIPPIVKSCTKFIEKYGIIFGIYRLSGMRSHINKLRQEFNQNPKMTMIDNEAISNDAHAVACVLKQYFRELPVPLLTFHMYERFIDLFKLSNTNTLKQPRSTMSNSDKDKHAKNVETKHNILKTNAKDMESNTTITNIDQTNDVACNDDTNCSDNVAVSTTTPNPADEIPEPCNNQQPPQQLRTSDILPARHGDESPTTTTDLCTKEITPSNQSHITTSVSDSQLVMLSSSVTTTTPDVMYQVRLDDLKQLLLELPRPHYQTLKYLMRHLACIASNGQKTGMDSKNVAIIWAPNLLKPRELELSAGSESKTLQVIGLQAVITEQLIKHHKFLFDDSDVGIRREPCRVTEQENK